MNLIESIKDLSFYTKRLLLYIGYKYVLNKYNPVKMSLNILRNDLNLYPTGSQLLYNSLNAFNNLTIKYKTFNNDIVYSTNNLFNSVSKYTTIDMNFGELNIHKGYIEYHINPNVAALFSIKPIYNYTSIYLKSLVKCNSKILLNFYLFFCRYKVEKEIIILFRDLIAYITQAKEYYYFPIFKSMMYKRFFPKFRQLTEINIFNFDYKKIDNKDYKLYFYIIINKDIKPIYRDTIYELFNETM